jgi:hypothetical protein
VTKKRSIRTARTAASLAATGTILSVIAGTGVASATTPTSFTAGDLVVYEVLGNTSAATATQLVDYSLGGTGAAPTATPSGFVVPLPTADSGSVHALTESGAALNDGELTLSADGHSLIATGYDTAPGTASVTGTKVPRTAAIVSASGAVDTTTALSDSTAEANNFRSATTAVTGGSIYLGSGGGAGITSDGGTTTTYLTGDKVHEVQVYDGQLYESTTKGILAVGSGLPTSGTQTTTQLVYEGVNGVSANFGPDQFAFATLGAGPGPDTLYVADGSNGATAGDPNAVEKYSLVSGVWTPTGSVTVPLAAGLAVTVSNGVADIYVTGATSTSAGSNTVLDEITDGTGFDGTLGATGTDGPTTVATAPTGDDFKGLAFSPTPVTPTPSTPESPLTVLLPAVGGVILVGGLALRRRKLRTA